MDHDKLKLDLRDLGNLLATLERQLLEIAESMSSDVSGGSDTEQAEVARALGTLVTARRTANGIADDAAKTRQAREELS